MTEYEKAVVVIKMFMRMADEGSPGHDAYSYALKAIEKQNPLPVRFETNSVTNLPISFCPKCGEHIQLYAYGNEVKQNYCPYCGQALKWDEVTRNGIMNEFKEGEYIIYANGDTFQIGKIKRIVEDGAFVWYSSGDTAAKTPFWHMHKIENGYCIGETSLGGAMV